MSDDEADLELLDLLRKSLGINNDGSAEKDTRVLASAEYVRDNSVDVALDMYGCRTAAEYIWNQMQHRSYSRQTWSEHELHPSSEDMSEDERLAFIFTMDLLNFSFWSDKGEEDRFSIEYRGKKWTGYWSLVAGLRRALDEGIEITNPHFWHNGDLTLKTVEHIFRSETNEEMPMLAERYDILLEAGEVLCKGFESNIANLVTSAENSAARLVNLLADHFPNFRDEVKFEGRKVRFLKRAQIFVADLWAAFNADGYGAFDDIDKITMFADYRIPQILHCLGCMSYSPVLESQIRAKREIALGSSWEVQLRGCSIWCVEALRQEIKRQHPEAQLNAILIDFFLYDAMQEMEKKADSENNANGTAEQEFGDTTEVVPKRRHEKVLEMSVEAKDIMPHHRTRSIWY